MKRRTLMTSALALQMPALRAAQPPDAPAWRLQKPPLHGGLSSPVGMGFDRTGRLYVANWSAGTVSRISSSGRQDIFASGLNGPSGLAISDSAEVFVASYSENLVWRFTPEGQQSVFVRDLATPAGLCFDARGRLLIANRRTHEILAVAPDGRRQTVARDLQTPVGAVELPDGELMVSNINGGISHVPASGRPITVNTQLRSPGPGIVRADDDAVFVVDYGGTTVNRIDHQGRRSIVADGLASPAGLVLAPDGSLLVATWGTHAIFKLLPPA